MLFCDADKWVIWESVCVDVLQHMLLPCVWVKSESVKID